jgi:uncharacterized protein (DUF2267 family)
MPVTGHRTFDATLEKTNRILKDIEDAYGWPKERRNQSYAALRAVLHAVRDRLPVEEAVQLSAQLPMLVRGLYFEGWKPSAVPVKMGREEFLERVRREFPYDLAGGIEQLIRTVLHALQLYVTKGELEGVRSTMPRDVAVLLQ